MFVPVHTSTHILEYTMQSNGKHGQEIDKKILKKKNKAK